MMKLQAYCNGQTDSTPDYVKTIKQAEETIETRYGFTITEKEINGDSISYRVNVSCYEFVLFQR